MKPLRLSQRNSLQSEIERAMVGATPSLQISVFLAGEKTFSVKLGETATYFDLASLTKVIFTTSRLMQWVDQGELAVEDPVVQYLPWLAHRDVRVRDLLTHSAGFRWWSPFYKELDSGLGFHERWMQLQLLLREESVTRPVTEAKYSDIDFLLLGLILESLERKPLSQIWHEFHNSIQGERLHFCADNKPVYPRKLYAPTEECPWRGRVMQGEVHDENTWSLGGVAPHAGLFGRLEDVERWALVLRDSYLGKKQGFVSPETARLFLKRSLEPSLGDWALGFMMPTPGGSSSGTRFSANSIGHTGFTGTSFWWDLDQDVMVLILANRVHPTRENKTFVQLRPQIHNWVMEQLHSS